MFLFLATATIVAAIAAVYDWKTGLIPNGLTFGALLFALVAHGVSGFVSGGASGALSEVLAALGGAAVCAIVPAILFALGGMGGGDVKLFAALGALCHLSCGLEAETYSFIVALLVAPAKLAYEGKLLRTLANSLALVVNPLRKKEARRPVPEELMTWFRLAPAICVGTLVMVLAHGGQP